MAANVKVEIVAPRALGDAERTAWRAFRDARPELSSPYFDLRYVEAAAELAPDAAVAVVRRGGELVAFLPIQRRSRRLQPLGAPVTDYHGLIASPEAGVSLDDVLRALGASGARFTGLVADPGQRGVNVTARPAMQADLSEGYATYLQARRQAGHGAFLKDKQRRERTLEREVGAVSFSLDADPEDALDFIVERKRRQMRRTSQVDVFACGWTVALLRRLAEAAEPDFGLRFAKLRVGGKLIAAEAGLLSGGVYHLWFPAYDVDFARYSPGALMTLRSLEALAGQGVRVADFGPGAEGYKASFADPAHTAYECGFALGGAEAAAVQALRLTFGAAPAAKRVVKAAAARLGRRLDRLAACEPSLVGRLGAAAHMIPSLSASHAWPAAAAALALGAGAALLID